VYRLAIKEKLDKKFKKLQKKDKEMLRIIDRKVQDILDDPYHFKPLRKRYKTSVGFIFDDIPYPHHLFPI